MTPALFLAWNTFQAFFLPEEVTMATLATAAFLTLTGPAPSPEGDIERLLPHGSLAEEDPAEMEECYRKLWATYRFRLARYRLDRGQVPYLTASTRMGDGIFFVFLNARKDSDRLRTQTAIDKLWLGAFSVDTNTGECFTYGSIYGDEERIYPETWKIPWIEFLRKIDPQKNY